MSKLTLVYWKPSEWPDVQKAFNLPDVAQRFPLYAANEQTILYNLAAGKERMRSVSNSLGLPTVKFSIQPAAAITTVKSQLFLDRVAGMLYAVAIGDALGVPAEFLKRSTPKIPYTGVINTKETMTIRFQWVSVQVTPASFSDDTKMTLALFRALLDKDMRYDEETVIYAYLEFANDKANYGLGKNTRALFKGVTTIDRGYQSRYNKLFPSDGKAAEKQQSNGSLMRASPLALLPTETKDYELTNPNIVNRDADRAYIFVLRGLLFAGDKEVVKAKLLQQFDVTIQAPEIKQAIKDAVAGVTRNVSGKPKGWVVNALYIAFYAFWKFDKMEDAMKYIILIPDSDTDTNAAIAGALYGAWLGVSGMKREELTKQNLEIVRTISPGGDQIETLLNRYKSISQKSQGKR